MLLPEIARSQEEPINIDIGPNKQLDSFNLFLIGYMS